MWDSDGRYLRGVGFRGLADFSVLVFRVTVIRCAIWRWQYFAIMLVAAIVIAAVFSLLVERPSHEIAKRFRHFRAAPAARPV